ncbi:hypothetical protein AAY473_035656, partial [Plecturocebus cupreus]
MDGNNQYQPFQKHTKRMLTLGDQQQYVRKPRPCGEAPQTGFRHVGQAGLELLISSGDLPASASQSAVITSGFCEFQFLENATYLISLHLCALAPMVCDVAAKVRARDRVAALVERKRPIIALAGTVVCSQLTLTIRWVLTILPRVVSNSWTQVILLPRLPKALGLQAGATKLGFLTEL